MPGDKKKKRPSLQRNQSSASVKPANYIYSVDDDLDELEEDMEREYLEGYNDALRYRLKRGAHSARDTPIQTLSPATSIQDPRQRVLPGVVSSTDTLKVAPHHHHHHHGLYQQLEDRSTPKLPQLSALPNSARYTDNIDSNDGSNPDEIGPIVEGGLDSDEGYNQDNDDNDDDYDDDGDDQSVSSMESFTLRERQNAINKTHPFGIRIWKPALYKKVRSVEREADHDIHEIETGDSTEVLDPADPLCKKHRKEIKWTVHLTNLIWSLTFGVFLFILCFLGSILLMLIEGACGELQYSKVYFNLGIYLLWPFGKIVYLQKDQNYLNEDQNEGTTIHEYQRWRVEEQTKLFFSASHTQVTDAEQQNGSASSASQPHLSNDAEAHLDADDKKLRFFGRGDWSLGRVLFYIYYYILLQPILHIIWLFCWLLIVTIPMSKVINVLTNHLRRHPLAMFFQSDRYVMAHNRMKKDSVLVCTYRSSGWHYWKYTVDGTNVILINMLFIVIFTIADSYFLKDWIGYESFITNESLIFALCLLSIIPLAYFIGQAVASISAQSSMGVGAVINAFFSTIVEIFLYCVALDQQKGLLVEGSMIGSILGGVLLLPGLSMCAGAFIRKTQRYNPASAGVSSTMLLFSMCVMFAPTVFHQIYGTYEVKCVPCGPGVTFQSSSASPISELAKSPSCQSCHFYQPPLAIDKLFTDILKPFSVVCAILLFLAYTIGLWFTLRTHAALIWQTPITEPVKKPEHAGSQESQVIEPQGHDAPNWSRQKSTIVLLTATLFYAVIAEILVDCVDSVLKNFPINPKFLGITIFALVPNTTEFLNAISFATHGNVALSMEIGSAYALQVCLIQIPSLVLYSLFSAKMEFGDQIRDTMFTLIFPNWDLVACVVSVGLFTYIYAEGKSNYFKGSMLILIYLVVLCGFWYTGEIDSSGGWASSFRIIS